MFACTHPFFNVTLIFDSVPAFSWGGSFIILKYVSLKSR